MKYHFEQDRYDYMGSPQAATLDIELIQLPWTKPRRNFRPILFQFPLPRSENTASPWPSAKLGL
ncbi:MAG TPA: hypothetical protein VEI95_08625, partial [Acidobacteriota bacterium]|nr:hypothetical protein [Acidobacteriota bacterium]